jgi:hypothetical protein
LEGETFQFLVFYSLLNLWLGSIREHVVCLELLRNRLRNCQVSLIVGDVALALVLLAEQLHLGDYLRAVEDGFHALVVVKHHP